MSIYADRGTAGHSILEECLKLTYEMGLQVSARDYLGKKVLVEDGEHARLSPSGAKRWMRCPASVLMAEQYPEPAEGPREIEIDDEIAYGVQVALDYVAQRVDELGPGTEVYSEAKVSPESRLPVAKRDCDGTVDVTIHNARQAFVEIIDLKLGRGVPVMPDDPQLDWYLLGTIAVVPGESLPGSARTTIVQPLCDKAEPRIRHREIESPAEWLSDFRARAEVTLARANHQDPDYPIFDPSEDACRFCPVGGGAKYSGNPVCEAYMRAGLNSVGVLADSGPGSLSGDPEAIFADIEAFSARDTRLLTQEQLLGLLDGREMLAGALQAAEAWATELLKTGAASEELQARYKLVRSRTRRSYADKDEDANLKALGRIKILDPDSGKLRKLGKKDLLEHRLKSVAQVEKILKAFQVPRDDARWSAFERLLIKPEGGLVLAPQSDPREAVESPRGSPEDFEEALSTPTPNPTPDKATEAETRNTGA